ncbi:2,3-diaminopropionate biosynthesis protein SbnB [Actinokineospora sp. PR83]|uniref:2,3-diaminopropionate biosynthesis protein SbnB n=1 Tax=Actinokineospora sp. PR83 TaxID=2884908 RepID=UPI001F1E9426|nr:2,3-diaminopropionate biosynthesis protein SbnB [Actinokineospora sp. PR83]MCG8914443.1 2,3-diaminopropionate biosynthesis protein SbnB [Actinokineospora sp. PR83]
MTVQIPDFSAISGAAVSRALAGRRRQVVDIVEAAYLAHDRAETVNPPSYFLRFPDAPHNRIIALPASIGGATGVAGLKWISSFPGNVAEGVPRASAVLVLNDLETGYPFACLESSIISAARTAASAALAARTIGAARPRPTRLGIFGAGLIARYVSDYLSAVGFRFDEIGVHDLSPEHADSLATHLRTTADRVVVDPTPESLIRSSDLVLFATTAATPHVSDPDWFAHHPLVLHVSLRDLSPEVILSATNVVDDIDHCLKADTSVHLVEQRTGSRDHVHATLAQALTGRFTAPADATVVFSPFGLGVLDLAVATFVHRQATETGTATPIPDFFHERHRHGEGPRGKAP